MRAGVEGGGGSGAREGEAKDTGRLACAPRSLVPEVIATVAHEPPTAFSGASLGRRRAGAAGTGEASRGRGRRVCRAAAATSERPSFCKTTISLNP
jgi:hypothetical protein